MAVGASFADLAVILVDAKKGVLVQTRRHARICALMGIRYFVFAVNKMDLIGFDEQKFNAIVAEINALKSELGLFSVAIIPLSATEGDNVTHKSANIPWYQGEALLPYLESIDIQTEKTEEGFYLPIQRVCRPNQAFRGFQGQIEAGSVNVGDELQVLPSGEKAHVKSIYVGNKDSQSAFVGQPVTIQLDREVDISRGCVLVKDTKPTVTRDLEATLLWMDDNELEVGHEFFVKLGTKLVPAQVTAIHYAIDVNTGAQNEVTSITKNGIANCSISFVDAVVADEFKQHKTLGELILIDRITNMTSAACVVTKVFPLNANAKPLTDAEIIKSIVKQDAKAFLFNTSVDGINSNLVKNVAHSLLLSGKLVYVYAEENAANAELVVANLLKAGVTVLVESASIKNLPNSIAIDSVVKFIEADQIVGYIQKNI